MVESTEDYLSVSKKLNDYNIDVQSIEATHKLR